MRERENEFDYPLVCDLCERKAGPGDWATHPVFGYRLCPECLKRGRKIRPRPLEEDWSEDGSGT